METNKRFIDIVNKLTKQLDMPYQVEKHFDGFIIMMPCAKYRYCDVVIDSYSYGNENDNFEYCFATYEDIPCDENIIGNLTIDEVVAKFRERYIDLNKELIKQYPFLMPKNRFSDEVVSNYDYSYTELDALPRGWYIDFGIDMCEEIKNALLEAQRKDPKGGYDDWNSDDDKKIPYLEGFTIVQIKEKFGGLRIYYNGAPEGVDEVISKYEERSTEICINCGKPAKYETKGWIMFVCDECAPKYNAVPREEETEGDN